MEINGKKALMTIVAVIASAMLVLGAVGMTISFLFMFSANNLDVMGGGLCFIAGAIMMSAALIALAILSLQLKGKD